tara:strand:- start:96 stop:446 length:351 start_codon:yes stop_codon:yes gene_type:complete
LENTEESKFQVIITDQAEIRFYEILDYLYDNYPLKRAEQIADELRDAAYKLHHHPERGTLESKLANRSQGYRYILYKRTSRTDIKVIYYIDQQSFTIYIADFFPTEKDNLQLLKRN